MSENAQVVFTPGVLPPGYCFSTWEQLNLDIINRLTGFLPGSYSTFNYGDTVPSVDDTDKPWFRTVLGVPDRWYVYVSGMWVARYRIPTSSFERMLWYSDLNSLYAYDGGDGTAVFNQTYTGSFWQEDPDFQAKFPIGPGVLPSTDTIAVAGTGGEEKHLLTGLESGVNAHTHNEQCVASNNNAIGGAGASYRTFGVEGSTVISTEIKTVASDVVAATNPHNNMPPYRGIYVVKRTQRDFWTA